MKEIEVLKGHEAPVWDVAVYPGRGTYLSASGDKTIRLWKDGKSFILYIISLLDDTRKIYGSHRHLCVIIFYCFKKQKQFRKTVENTGLSNIRIICPL